ncbi:MULTISPECIES: peptidyl-prolyl cis-trans isomerase [Paraliobacillus]|uniref:peptidylprolyl isomerase n=1 Tax=Paraliobacillus TaxID=200903 RepID=UPI000DD4E709|nr:MULTISPECIES: peptidyl-prolyl cis-trans isomerase [Paraliobacillus]
MTRKLLLGMIVLLLVTNIVTIAIWMIDRNDNEDEEFTVDFDQNEPVATIGQDEITYGEWINHLEKAYGREALEEEINEKVIRQLAEEKNISINEEVVELELSLLFTMEGILSEAEVEEKEEEWSESIRNRLYLEELITEDMEITDQELQTYYDQYRDQYQFSQTIQLSHIVVSDQTTANKVIDELDAGASFTSLAREYTVDEETRNDGGYLGYYTETSSFLPSAYYDQAMSMQEHTYSEPFIVDGGVAILYLHRELAEIDLSYDALKDHLRREVALEKMEVSPSAASLWNELEIEWIYE